MSPGSPTEFPRAGGQQGYGQAAPCADRRRLPGRRGVDADRTPAQGVSTRRGSGSSPPRRCVTPSRTSHGRSSSGTTRYRASMPWPRGAADANGRGPALPRGFRHHRGGAGRPVDEGRGRRLPPQREPRPVGLCRGSDATGGGGEAGTPGSPRSSGTACWGSSAFRSSGCHWRIFCSTRITACWIGIPLRRRYSATPRRKWWARWPST